MEYGADLTGSQSMDGSLKNETDGNIFLDYYYSPPLLVDMDWDLGNNLYMAKITRKERIGICIGCKCTTKLSQGSLCRNCVEEIMMFGRIKPIKRNELPKSETD